MQRASNPSTRRHVLFSLTALLVVAADQLTKLWIRSSLDVGDSLFELGCFQIIHIKNTGASFGLFKDHSFGGAAVEIAVHLVGERLVDRLIPVRGHGNCR